MIVGAVIVWLLVIFFAFAFLTTFFAFVLLMLFFARMLTGKGTYRYGSGDPSSSYIPGGSADGAHPHSDHCGHHSGGGDSGGGGSG